MKIAVLIPSDEYRSYAGARIRYGRVAPMLAAEGVALDLCDIAEFAPDKSDADVLIISKCHDSRALLAAALMGERGRVVGVDLFDDYFSQWEDSRLARFRNWLRQLLPMCDFVACSTHAMAEVVGRYRAGIPVHVMNDPAASLDLDSLPDLLDRKLAEGLASGRMTVAWFGVGDNPHFPIGLHDLAAFSASLARLAHGGFELALRIMTNRRALTATGLAQIAQLPVQSEVLEWSEEGERSLLQETFVAFLPVNEQPFSRAKSLNRAVTSLGAGCQVLSTGFPLYDQLGEFIYRDPSALLADLSQGSLKLGRAAFGQFQSKMDQLASPATEAARLREFLEQIAAGPRPQGILALVHGVATNGVAHKMVRAANGLSVASPYCATPLGFDVIFRGVAGDLAMWVTEKTKSRLTDAVKPGATMAIEGKKFVEVLRMEGASVRHPNLDRGNASLPVQLANYGPVMEEIGARLDQAFGECRILVSESAQLPLTLAA